MAWVGVIPKEGVAVPILLLVWHLLYQKKKKKRKKIQNFKNSNRANFQKKKKILKKKFKKSVSYQKKDGRGHVGMTTTQDIRELTRLLQVVHSLLVGVKDFLCMGPGMVLYNIP